MERRDELLQRVDQSKHLFLIAVNPLGIAELEIIVKQAVVNEAMRGKIESTNLPESLHFLLDGAAPIESLEGCLAFRLYWKCYAAFLVTEECVGSCGKYEDEAFEGDRLRTYSRSHFLDHLQRDTGAHTQPLIHVKLLTDNHLIDVASYEPPAIEVVDRSDHATKNEPQT